MRVGTREGSYPPAAPRRGAAGPAGLAGSLRWDGGFSASNEAPSFAVFVFSRVLFRLAGIAQALDKGSVSVEVSVRPGKRKGCFIALRSILAI